MEEVHRSSNKGFFVDLNVIRGLMLTLQDKFNDTENLKLNLRVSCKDGSTQIFESDEGFASLINSGRKEIIKIVLEYEGRHLKDGISSVSISLSDLSAVGYDDINSISYDLRGKNHNWIKSTQLDLDEFISSIERFNFSSLTTIAQLGTICISLFSLAGFLSFGLNTVYSYPAGSLDHLKIALSRTNLSAGDAIYAYAVWHDKLTATPHFPFYVPLAFFIMPLSLIIFQKSFVERIFKPYIFYFGGMVSIVNQRRVFHSVLWGGFLLALIVGLTANYLSKIIFHY